MDEGRLLVWIVNFNSSSLVETCVESLIETGGVDEVLVLDNGSEPHDYAYLKEFASSHANVTLLRSELNLGFGGGHNAIAQRTRHAPADFVWLLNPDTIIEKGAPSRLRCALARGDLDVVSPLILQERGHSSRIWFSGGFVDTDAGHVVDSQIGREVAALETCPELLPTSFMTGAAPMMTYRVWETVGGFDERLFLYWEDVDWSIRATQAGFRMGVLRDARIVHLEGASSRSNKGRRATAYYYMSRNRLVVCRGAGTPSWRLLLGQGALPLARFIAYALVREGPGRVRRLSAIMRGLSAGLKMRPKADREGS